MTKQFRVKTFTKMQTDILKRLEKIKEIMNYDPAMEYLKCMAPLSGMNLKDILADPELKKLWENAGVWHKKLKNWKQPDTIKLIDEQVKLNTELSDINFELWRLTKYD